MAALKHASGVALVIKLGDGASPEAFDPLCSANAQRGISFNGAENEFEIPDCDDPNKIAWIARERRANSASVDFAGILNTSDLKTAGTVKLFETWSLGETRNAQVVVDVPATDGGVIFEGGWKLSDLKITGARGGKIEVSGTLNSDGEITSAVNV